MQLLKRRIDSLVNENYVYGRALSSLGINFFEQKDQVLEDVLKMYGIENSLAIRSFYAADSTFRPLFKEIETFPLPFLIEYLKHSHKTYIKDLLPYINKIVQNIPHSNQEAVQDLKQVFPVFVEDFIHHIYEEEDKLFNYILTLSNLSLMTSVSVTEIPLKYLDYSLEEVFEQHVDDDEMKSLRALIDEISADHLELSVAISEIRFFDRELSFHAEIENQLLFPKAIELEKSIWREIHSMR